MFVEPQVGQRGSGNGYSGGEIMQYSFADFLQEYGPIDHLILDGLWEPMGPCIDLIIDL